MHVIFYSNSLFHGSARNLVSFAFVVRRFSERWALGNDPYNSCEGDYSISSVQMNLPVKI